LKLVRSRVSHSDSVARNTLLKHPWHPDGSAAESFHGQTNSFSHGMADGSDDSPGSSGQRKVFRIETKELRALAGAMQDGLARRPFNDLTNQLLQIERQARKHRHDEKGSPTPDWLR